MHGPKCDSTKNAREWLFFLNIIISLIYTKFITNAEFGYDNPLQIMFILQISDTYFTVMKEHLTQSSLSKLLSNMVVQSAIIYEKCQITTELSTQKHIYRLIDILWNL